MYYFFEKHRILRTLLDYTILCGTAISIFYLFRRLDFSTAWFVPIYINLYVLCLFFYTDKVHEPKEKRMKLVQWLDNIRWINGIGLAVHVVFGYYTKYSHKQVVKPLWTKDKDTILITIAIYLFCIIIPSLLIYLRRKYRG